MTDGAGLGGGIKELSVHRDRFTVTPIELPNLIHKSLWTVNRNSSQTEKLIQIGF